VRKGLPEVSRIKFAIQSYGPPGEALGVCGSGKRDRLEAAELGHAGAKRTAPGRSAEVCRKQLLPATAGHHHDPSPPGRPRASHGRRPHWGELTEPRPVCRPQVTALPASDARPDLCQQVPAPAPQLGWGESRRWRRRAAAPLPSTQRPGRLGARQAPAQQRSTSMRRVGIPVSRNQGRAALRNQCWDTGLRGGWWLNHITGLEACFYSPGARPTLTEAFKQTFSHPC